MNAQTIGHVPARRPLKPIMLVRPPLGILNDPTFWDELEGSKDVAANFPEFEGIMQDGRTGSSRGSGSSTSAATG